MVNGKIADFRLSIKIKTNRLVHFKTFSSVKSTRPLKVYSFHQDSTLVFVKKKR